MRKRTILVLALLAISAAGTAAFALREKPAPTKSSWPPKTPEYFAGFAGNQPIEWVRELLDEHPEFANAKSPVGKSPIHNLAWDNKAQHLRLLLERGADPNGAGCRGKNYFHKTPLTEAAQHGHLEAARLLLEFGADPDYVPPGGMHVAYTAARSWGRGQFIHLLHAGGANFNPDTKNGYTPLTSAVQFLRAENARALIDCGADVMTRTEHDTYLHWLVAVSRQIGRKDDAWMFLGTEQEQRDAAKKIARMLLMAGLPIDVRNSKGATVFEEADERGVSLDWLHAVYESVPASKRTHAD